MNRFGRLLVVVEPTETASGVLGRAILIARHFLASIDVLLCARRDEVVAGERFLKGLIASVAAGDLHIEASVRTGPSCADIVAARLAERPADLIVKFPNGGGDASRLHMWSSNDCQLLQGCAAHVLLTRARPWHPVPRFAAAIEDPTEGPRVSRAVLGTLTCLSMTLDARSEVLRVVAPGAGAAELSSDLRAIAAGFHLPEETWCLLDSNPVEALADVVAARALDLLVLGAQSGRKEWREFFGSLSARIARRMDCDLLVVNDAR